MVLALESPRPFSFRAPVCLALGRLRGQLYLAHHLAAHTHPALFLGRRDVPADLLHRLPSARPAVGAWSALARWRCRRQGVPASDSSERAQFGRVLSPQADLCPHLLAQRQAPSVEYALPAEMVALLQAAFVRRPERLPRLELYLVLVLAVASRA